MPLDRRRMLSQRIRLAAATMTTAERRQFVTEFEHELAACALIPRPRSRPTLH